MRLSLLAGAFSLAIGALAAEGSEPQVHFEDAQAGVVYGSMADNNKTASADGSFCINASDAEKLGEAFGLLISAYTDELAVKLLAEGFTDQSDSVNHLIINSPLPDQALGSLTFDSKKAFLDGQGAQPPVPFDILNTWHTCDTVIIRWVSHQEPDQVQGISIGEVQPAKEGEGGGVGDSEKYQIKTIWAEFNSGSWLKNLGSPECDGKA